MKEGWEYKKLGEITTTINGLWTGKKPPFINVAVVRNTNFTKDCKLDMTNVAYLDVEQKQYSTRKLLPGDIIIEKSGGSDKQPVGRPVLFNIAEGEFSFSNFTCTLRIINSNLISPVFLHYALFGAYLRGDTFKMQSKTTGIHNLDFKAYNRLQIPIPPLTEQQRIVEELDLLSSIIEKKKEQLKELDALAQSLFYDMFGDPVTNEKGWEVTTLNDVCISMVRGPFGSALKKEYFVEKGDNTYKIYEQKHAIQKSAIIGTYYISKEKYEELQRFEVFPNDIIMSCSGTIGELFIIPNNAEKGIMNQALLKFTLDSKKVDSFYFLFIMQYVKRNMSVHGSGLQNIGSVKTIKGLCLGLPPLPLQQQFAQKVEAIERQKELIKQSIAETETLFNSRMDYYFN